MGRVGEGKLSCNVGHTGFLLACFPLLTRVTPPSLQTTHTNPCPQVSGEGGAWFFSHRLLSSLSTPPRRCPLQSSRNPLGYPSPIIHDSPKPKPCPPRPPHHSPLDPSFDLSHGRTLRSPPGRDAVQEKICQDCCCCCYQWPCWGLPVSLLLLSRLHASSEL